MSEYFSVEDAIKLPGLRIAFSQGVPGPWGLAVRAFCDIKGIAYIPVLHEVGGRNEALEAWTGQSSAPVAVYNDERPRANWSELLLLTERLSPKPALVPDDESDRAMMFGLCHEICGEDGLGWNIRTLVLARLDAVGDPITPLMKRKYSDNSTSLERASRRLNAIVVLLGERLTAQRALGSEFFVGNAVSAADIYWAMFSNLLCALPDEICPMPSYYRERSALNCAILEEGLPDILIDHRDRTLQSYCKLPLTF